MCQLLRRQTQLGLTLGNTAHVVSCFADDTQLIARDPVAHITQLERIESFCAFSGFKLNRNARDPAAHITQLELIESFCAFSGFKLNRNARDPAAHITQLELIESFCAFSGFKLNRNKTTLLTARESAKYPSGAGDAIDVALRSRARQIHKSYQLTWLLPDKHQAPLIDRLMLQFLHDEPNSWTRTRHLRQFSQALDLMAKRHGGLGLSH
ncbi:hypothetical protein H310_14239 [Aphanomyces invadans]|uniref:Reverse transcriptase domain-containing protein n=1 Tax=Aphanomyces invadans TaxID=157072 RepID=A0A024TBU7_9STRA|nr:hypothetical protein H310_14239 [Aphanomyces invadans]ETV91076.1 hypothetical protein H310_14239 [Aphanomyces invadans]|eukprot:XP_008880272.1 hypothetical protein H310_14239 [Aphanomyces invadans]